MNYRDTLVTCQECKRQFIFTVEKQRQMSQRGLEVSIPVLCDTCAQRPKYGDKLHGRIKWFSLEKGYGFLVQDDGSELFVHRTGVHPAADGSALHLEEGQEVLYQVTETPKGLQAVDVTPYSNAQD